MFKRKGEIGGGGGGLEGSRERKQTSSETAETLPNEIRGETMIQPFAKEAFLTISGNLSGNNGQFSAEISVIRL